MNRNIKITVILCLAVILLVLFFTYQRTTRNNSAAVSPEVLREMGALVYEEPVTLSGFSLEDHQGQPYDNAAVTGHWSLVFFGFTSCPDICPLTMVELADFYRDAAAPVQADTEVVMISVDPFRDSPEKLAAYVSGFHPAFVGVTGPYEDIAQVARQLYVAHSAPPEGDHAAHNYSIEHSGNILIINPRGEYHGFLESSISAERIAAAYAAIRAAYEL